jgi:hypothetical protein
VNDETERLKDRAKTRSANNTLQHHISSSGSYQGPCEDS